MFDGCLAAFRTRSGACDTLSRHCVRHVRHQFAFSLASALRSTASAAGRPALFGGFIATMAESDFSCPCIIGFGSSRTGRAAEFLAPHLQRGMRLIEAKREPQYPDQGSKSWRPSFYAVTPSSSPSAPPKLEGGAAAS